MADPRFFKQSGSYTLESVAKVSHSRLLHDAQKDFVIQDVASLDQAGTGDITFLQNPKYKKDFLVTQASACFVTETMAKLVPSGTVPLISKDPYKSYGLFAQILYPEPSAAQKKFTTRVAASAKIHPEAVVSETAVVGENAEIGRGSFIAPQAVIDHGVVIGEDTEIGVGAYVGYAYVGNRVLIHPGVRIGQRGFGFAPDAEKPVKIPQLGRVIIEDDVEIGANSTIDRGAGPDTIIGQGTMIDNLVQIAHNVRIGKNCIIVAQVGISGSTEIGDFVSIGGQAGITGHLKIGRFAQIAGKSGVMNDVPEREVWGGIPAVPIKDWHRQTISIKNLARKGKRVS